MCMGIQPLLHLKVFAALQTIHVEFNINLFSYSINCFLCVIRWWSVRRRTFKPITVNALPWSFEILNELRFNGSPFFAKHLVSLVKRLFRKIRWFSPCQHLTQARTRQLFRWWFRTKQSDEISYFCPPSQELLVEIRSSLIYTWNLCTPFIYGFE